MGMIEPAAISRQELNSVAGQASKAALLCVATVGSLVVLRLLSGVDYLKTFEASQLYSLSTLTRSAQGPG